MGSIYNKKSRINPLRPPVSASGGSYGTSGWVEGYKAAESSGAPKEDLRERRRQEIEAIKKRVAQHRISAAQNAQNRAIGKVDAPSEGARMYGGGKFGYNKFPGRR